VNAAAWAGVPLGGAVLVVGALWLAVRVLDLSVQVWRFRRGGSEVARLVEAVEKVGELLDGHAHDTLQEAELLRGVVEEIRDDERTDRVLDEVLEEMRRRRGTVERRQV
jgi:hypothetical protein